MEPDRAKALRRRIYLKSKHLDFLRKLEDNPSTIDAELYRLHEAIEQFKEQISSCSNQIFSLSNMRDNVHAHIEEAKTELRGLTRLLNAELIEQLKEEMQLINKELKDL